jgi:(1->4)-alpha-D-glucan 1-alpha-D-glucosylmutase
MQASSSTLIELASQLEECLEKIDSGKDFVRPVSTYRLQFHKAFRFEDARRLVPYLHQLGVSHCYSSPILKARSGSNHGYDIIDHNQLNPEIGTEEELRQLVAELKAHGMGLIVDTVPNHMGVGHGTNPWWQDVLQNGRTSRYADFFDIDWEPIKPELRNKVLIPILGEPYGEDLEKGNIKLVFENSRFAVRYFDKVLPVDPQTIPLIFEAKNEGENPTLERSDSAVAEFRSLLEVLGNLSPSNTTEAEKVAARRREAPALLERLGRLAEESGEIRREIEKAVEAINGTSLDAHSFDALHRLLEAQVYRLAFWRVSGEEINYRRFFDINDLVGLRMEDPRVFAETHKLFRRLLANGLISGIRIDHPDGLLNPAQYFTRLQMLYTASQCIGTEPQVPLGENGIEMSLQNVYGARNRVLCPLYVVIEKILETGERLPEEWPVDGTVGYEFANLVNGILIDNDNERAFTNIYHRVIGGSVSIEKLIYESKKRIMHRALASEVSVLTHLLNEISSQNRRARDFTRTVLRDAIRETIACFPVYRTYIDERGNVQERDRRYIDQAIYRAKIRNGNLAAAVFDFLRSILLLEGNDSDLMIHGYRKQLYFTLKFQQLTGPVMAKGLEDTACYVYNRFVSVNEVGGSPADFGVPIEEFHTANEMRAEQWPNSMLGTSTHDTKRSEDVRARLDVLSEMPGNWATQVMKWRRVNRSRKAQLSDGRLVPDDNEEYLLYQTIVGAWPMRMDTEDERFEFVRRIQQYMEKAVHEAKVNVSWLNQNPEYVAGLNTFIDRILAPRYRGRINFFRDSVQKLLAPLVYFGAMNSLTQTVLKLTCPGVPDVYQGQELFDFSLVDPDNRRPVDFDLRHRDIRELLARAESGDLIELCQELLRSYRDGRIKMWVTMRTLNLRQSRKEVFRSGSYMPLQVKHGKDEHVVSFARIQGNQSVIVAGPRLSCTLMKGNLEPPIAGAWSDSELMLPPEANGRHLQNIFTGEILRAREGLLCRELFAHFPVAVLTTG